MGVNINIHVAVTVILGMSALNMVGCMIVTIKST